MVLPSCPEIMLSSPTHTKSSSITLHYYGEGNMVCFAPAYFTRLRYYFVYYACLLHTNSILKGVGKTEVHKEWSMGET